MMFFLMGRDDGERRRQMRIPSFDFQHQAAFVLRIPLREKETASPRPQGPNNGANKQGKRLTFGLCSLLLSIALFVRFPLISQPRPPPLKKKLLSLSHSVSIKGPLDGDAVLCTRDATFDLKTVETTNSLLLVPEGEVRGDEEKVCFPFFLDGV